jgi:hypothetical protein
MGNEQPEYYRKELYKLMDFFNPIEFDAAKWVGMAKGCRHEIHNTYYKTS